MQAGLDRPGVLLIAGSIGGKAKEGKGGSNGVAPSLIECFFNREGRLSVRLPEFLSSVRRFLFIFSMRGKIPFLSPAVAMQRAFKKFPLDSKIEVHPLYEPV